MISDRNISNKEKVIDVQGLKIAFGTQQVLNGVSFHLYKGENLVILGKSGSGKSVLIKCITELLKPDGGSIMVLDKDMNKVRPRELSELRKKIGFLFQSGALYDSMSVKENLEFPLVRSGKKLGREEKVAKINEVLENVGLAEAL